MIFRPLHFHHRRHLQATGPTEVYQTRFFCRASLPISPECAERCRISGSAERKASPMQLEAIQDAYQSRKGRYVNAYSAPDITTHSGTTGDKRWSHLWHKRKWQTNWLYRALEVDRMSWKAHWLLNYTDEIKADDESLRVFNRRLHFNATTSIPCRHHAHRDNIPLVH